MKLKIFIIDDEESIRDTLRWYLEDLGHEVLTFTEPAECDVHKGCLCQKSSPCADALLIDYNMPGMNGLDFLEKLVDHGCKGDPKNMFLMSGDTTRIDRGKVAELGCHLAQKPFSFEILDQWLCQVELRKKQKLLS